jgi:hypothetical protein
MAMIIPFLSNDFLNYFLGTLYSGISLYIFIPEGNGHAP